MKKLFTILFFLFLIVLTNAQEQKYIGFGKSFKYLIDGTWTEWDSYQETNEPIVIRQGEVVVGDQVYQTNEQTSTLNDIAEFSPIKATSGSIVCTIECYMVMEYECLCFTYEDSAVCYILRTNL